MAKEVRIKLTAEQKAKIKSATGKVMSEIRVGTLRGNLAVSSPGAVSARSVRNTAMRGERTWPRPGRSATQQCAAKRTWPRPGRPGPNPTRADELSARSVRSNPTRADELRPGRSPPNETRADELSARRPLQPDPRR